MVAAVTGYFSGSFFDPGYQIWSGISGDPGRWLVVLVGVSKGTLAEMGGDPGGARGGWPPGAWQLLAEVDAGPGLPKWRAWATAFVDAADYELALLCPSGADIHSHLYFVDGLRSFGDAGQVFSAGAASSAASSASQTVPLYAPDDSGLLIGGWLSGGVVNYTSLGPLTARAEVDGSISTSRTGEQAITAHGPSTRSATASAAQPWAAISIVCRDVTGSVTFPSQPLQVRTEIAPGASPDADPAAWAGLWTDITTDVYARQPIAITRGRADEASAVGPSTMSLELNNSAGKYTRLNPLSPFFGKLSKNTPIRTWVNPGSGWECRYTGFVSEWPPRQQGGGVDQHMPITASGVTRRMNQGKALRSPLFRAITARGGFTAYWPLETDASSGVVGGQPMRTIGPSSFGSGGPAGSAGTMSFDSKGSASATVLGMPNVGGWRVSWWLEIPVDFNPTNDVSHMVYWTTAGSVADQWFSYLPGGSYGSKLIIEAFQTAVSEFPVIGTVDLAGRGPVLVTAWAQPTGGGDVQIGFNVTGSGFTDGGSTLVTADAIAPINSININTHMSDLDNPPTKGTISHLLVAPDPNPFGFDSSWLFTAGQGYTGERAADRVRRLAAEEGVPVVVVGDDGGSEPMGPQPVDRLLTILQDCETADGGQLHERRDGRLAYRPRAARYNATPALTLNHSAGHTAPPFEPQDDDQRTRNDVTASRPDGGAVRVTDPGSIATVGLYDEQVTVNVADDDQLDDQAGWRVHLGIGDDYRYPSISPNLNGKAAALIPGWLALDAGDVVAVTSPPVDLPPGTISTIAEGYTENIDTVSWTATINASPGAPWKVITLDDTTLGRLDTDGSVLANAATSSATSLTIATTDGPAWTTSAGDMPFDITVGGEQVTVTAVAPYLTDAFGRTTSNGWGNADTGQAWSTAGPAAAANYSVSGGFGRHSLSVVNQHMFTVTPSPSTYFDIRADLATDKTATGADIILYLVGRFADTSNYYMANVGLTTSQAVVLTIRRNVAGTETHLGGGPTGLVHTANARLAVRFQGIGSQLRAKIWPVAESEPIDWQVTVTDTSLTAAGSVGFRSLLTGGNTNTLPVVATYDSVTVIPQIFTVTRSVNGVVKSHSVGEDVRLATPPILAL